MNNRRNVTTEELRENLINADNARYIGRKQIEHNTEKILNNNFNIDMHNHEYIKNRSQDTQARASASRDECNNMTNDMEAMKHPIGDNSQDVNRAADLSTQQLFAETSNVASTHALVRRDSLDGKSTQEGKSQAMCDKKFEENETLLAQRIGLTDRYKQVVTEQYETRNELERRAFEESRIATDEDFLDPNLEMPGFWDTDF